MVQFKEIFLQPREQNLKAIRKLAILDSSPKTIIKEYEKLLRFEKGEGLMTE